MDLITSILPPSGATSKLFREYIGADLKSIKFTDVPVNPNVDFHFILSFAIDYTNDTNPTPTDGRFNVFWHTEHLGPNNVSKIKSQHKNVRVAVSLGGDVVTKNQYAYFAPNSVPSWVSNAVTTLTQIIKTYNLDGIDIDYEHFSTDPDTFGECIGQLITILKRDGVISFASIAPYDDDDQVQNHYQALWGKYGQVIDYVNYQFYAHDDVNSVDQFKALFDRQLYSYNGGRVLASFATDPQAAGRFTPDEGFIAACEELNKEGKLGGIFVWCADDSKEKGYGNEEACQELLASA